MNNKNNRNKPKWMENTINTNTKNCGHSDN